MLGASLERHRRASVYTEHIARVDRVVCRASAHGVCAAFQCRRSAETWCRWRSGQNGGGDTRRL